MKSNAPLRIGVVGWAPWVNHARVLAGLPEMSWSASPIPIPRSGHRTLNCAAVNDLLMRC